MLKVPLQLRYRMSLSCRQHNIVIVYCCIVLYTLRYLIFAIASYIYHHLCNCIIYLSSFVSDTNTIITSIIYLLKLLSLLCCISHHKHHRLSTESLSRRTTTITLQYIPNFANHIIVVIMFVYAHTSSRQIMIWQ